MSRAPTNHEDLLHVFPSMAVNEGYVVQLKAAASFGDTLLFLCRLRRSLTAACAGAASGRLIQLPVDLKDRSMRWAIALSAMVGNLRLRWK